VFVSRLSPREDDSALATPTLQLRQVQVARKRRIAPVLIVDKDEEARRELASLLGDAGYPVVEAASGEEAIRIVREQEFSLALLEVALEDVSGYEVCRTIREEVGQDPRVMFISRDRAESYDRVAGLLIGADDYVAKPYAADELLARVRALLRHNQRPAVPASGLTVREQEVLTLLAEGLAPDEIADRLFISTRTVGTHIEHVFRKLGVRTRAQAVAVAFREGLVELPS
jgi:DNA-binding NarL/FixJ family response regulator